MSASNQPSTTISRTGRFGLVSITIRADSGESAHPTQAKVIAQDRWLVMDPETSVRDSAQSAAELGFAAARDADRKLGEVVLRRDSQPLRLWAIIHDLNCQPSSRKSWIATALLNTFHELARRRIESVSMPCFGYAQGIVDTTEFFDMLATAIRKTPVVRRLYIDLDCTVSERAALCDALLKLNF
ncbi:MAG: hypothetical protein ACI9DC_002988 [Gammaproteobacteria bacterium]|jgi:hypothetical protein